MKKNLVNDLKNLSNSISIRPIGEVAYHPLLLDDNEEFKQSIFQKVFYIASKTNYEQFIYM